MALTSTAQPSSATRSESEKDAIVVSDLRRDYGSLRAVDGISFTVRAGEIFGLLGPNGAGKTTAISMLTGMTVPTSGKMTVNQCDMTRPTDDAKRLIGVVPQALALYTTITGRDNLKFFGRVYGVTGPRLTRRISDVLEIVGLRDRADDVVDTYSGGMKRRLNLAASLLHEPKVLFLDEPTVGVDPQSRNAIFEAIEVMHRGGLTVMYTTHYMEEAQRFCERVAIMDKGRIIALDTPAKLCRSIGGGICRAEISGENAPRLIKHLKSLDAVNTKELRDSTIEFEAEPLTEALTAFFAQAARLEVRITSLNIYESSLETVFLKLTGKSLRDDK